MIKRSALSARFVGRALVACLGLLALPAVVRSQEHPKPPAPKAVEAKAEAKAEAKHIESKAPEAKATVSGEAAGTVATPASASAASASATAATKPSGIPTSVTIERETFDYSRTGRRDPYKSLMSSDELRPLLSDLKLTAVAFDSTGLHSVAILRDMNSKQQYMLKVGQQLGRLRVASIKHKSVVFTIDEFGFNRQETLQMGSDTTKSRTP